MLTVIKDAARVAAGEREASADEEGPRGGRPGGHHGGSRFRPAHHRAPRRSCARRGSWTPVAGGRGDPRRSVRLRERPGDRGHLRRRSATGPTSRRSTPKRRPGLLHGVRRDRLLRRRAGVRGAHLRVGQERARRRRRRPRQGPRAHPGPGRGALICGRFGRLSGVKVDDMEAQCARGVARAKRPAGNLGAVVAASRGWGNRRLFEQMGGRGDRRGPGANPSAADFARAWKHGSAVGSCCPTTRISSRPRAGRGTGRGESARGADDEHSRRGSRRWSGSTPRASPRRSSRRCGRSPLAAMRGGYPGGARRPHRRSRGAGRAPTWGSWTASSSRWRGVARTPRSSCREDARGRSADILTLLGGDGRRGGGGGSSEGSTASTPDVEVEVKDGGSRSTRCRWWPSDHGDRHGLHDEPRPRRARASGLQRWSRSRSTSAPTRATGTRWTCPTPEFYESYARRRVPDHSQPARAASRRPTRPSEAYDDVLVLTLSAEFSGTYDSAVAAAGMVDRPVEVLDTRSARWGRA